MTNYDDLLREKDNEDQFNDSQMAKHWAALEKKIDTQKHQPSAKYRSLFKAVAGIAAVSLVMFFAYVFLNGKKQQPAKTNIASVTPLSAIQPLLKGTDVPYEIFSFDAATGDTLFTQNGSIIIFPKNSVLNSKGEVVSGNINVRTREFNDPFDYSIAGIPMAYDSAGIKYTFISSAMIDIGAYQNGEMLQVNPAAKPQLNLVSTNKERQTNLYKLDTVNGQWMNKGNDEVNLVQSKKPAVADVPKPGNASESIGSADKPSTIESFAIPIPPQKASAVNPVINVSIDPASFKELLVYDGLKFEVTDANADQVEEDSKTEWQHIELVRAASGAYKVVFSTGNKKVTYDVKPVLEGKDFEAAEKLYQEKLKAYASIQTERKKDEAINKKLSGEQRDLTVEEQRVENNRIEELNKLIAVRNKLIEAENIKIMAMNKENRRLRDSAIKVNNELFEKQQAEFQKQQAVWEQRNRTLALEQNLIRSFQIDGFGYWNCDQPTLPAVQQYVSAFKNKKTESITYTNLCIAVDGINRIQNYYDTKSIGLIPNRNYFGWAINGTQFYYFTKNDFKKAVKTTNPDSISIIMTLYEGDVKDYGTLKGYLFNVNNGQDISKN